MIDLPMDTPLTDAPDGWRQIVLTLQETASKMATTLADWLSVATTKTGTALAPALDRLGLEAIAPEQVGQTLFLAFLSMMLFLALLVFSRRGGKRSGAPTLAAQTRRARYSGFAAILVLVSVLGGWSLMAPLASASLASGVVSPDGKRKTVEHLEGGIIRQIHVREGDVVAAGDALFTLEDVQARARYRELQDSNLHLRAVEARLLAERTGADVLHFPDDLTASTEDTATKAMAAQEELFESRRATFEAQRRILGQRINQLEDQNDGLRAVITGYDQQLALIAEEIEGVQALYERGLEKYPRLLALRRAEAELNSGIATNRAHISENMQKIGEAEWQILGLRERTVETANTELTQIQQKLSQIQTQLPSRQDVLTRTIIRAPIPGVVMNVHPTTESGVVRPGEALLDIVPQDSSLIIDARVRPTDIERVRPGMKARVVLTAFRQRDMPLIHGDVRSVSADRLEEDRTGTPYYLAKVVVNPDDLARAPNVKLVPGMPAEIMILDGEQNLMGYLLEPFLRSIRHSFREN